MGMIWNTLLMWAFGVYMAFSTRELYRIALSRLAFEIGVTPAV